MQRLGFIHDMMDVKVLLLLVLSRCNYPVSTQEAYELCYQDVYKRQVITFPPSLEAGWLSGP